MTSWREGTLKKVAQLDCDGSKAIGETLVMESMLWGVLVLISQ